MHGPDTDPSYAGSYPSAALGRWAAQITEWTRQNRRVLVYSNNEGGGNAVRNACELRDLVMT